MASDAVLRSMARRTSSIGLVEGEGEFDRELSARGEQSSSSIELSSSDDESAFSHPAFACSNNSLVSVTVDTLTHSRPP